LWPEEEKLGIMAEAFSPGACVSEVARRRDVAPSLIYRWRWEMRAEAASAGFAPVLVGPEREERVACLPAEQAPAMTIEFKGVTIKVAADAPPVLVERALRALRR